MLAAFGSGQVFLSMLWFFMFVIWLWLLIAIFSDIFRSRDLGGWGKAGWSIFVIVLPFLGIFTYLIARGHKMTEHAAQDAQAQEAYLRGQVQSAMRSSSADDQLATLTSMHDQGVLTDEEYERMRAKLHAA